MTHKDELIRSLKRCLDEATYWIYEARGCKPQDIIGYDGWADEASRVLMLDNAKTNKQEMDRKIDAMIDKIQELGEPMKARAVTALSFWNSAKIQEVLGLGPMEARHEYKDAYNCLKEMGFNVSGMIEPYNNEYYVSMACCCLGAKNGDPYCPCEMRRSGLEPSGGKK